MCAHLYYFCGQAALFIGCVIVGVCVWASFGTGPVRGSAGSQSVCLFGQYWKKSFGSVMHQRFSWNLAAYGMVYAGAPEGADVSRQRWVEPSRSPI